MKYRLVLIVEGADEGAVDAVYDAASNEAYHNPDVISIKYVSADDVVDE